MTDIAELASVNAGRVKALAGMEIYRIEDLLLTLPRRYLDEAHIHKIARAPLNTTTLIEGRIEKCRVLFAKKSTLSVIVNDGTHLLELRFFHFNKRQRGDFSVGRRLTALGEIRLFKRTLEMVHPKYRFYDEHEIIPLKKYYSPVYPTAEGIGQVLMQRLIDGALQWLDDNGDKFRELLPAQILRQCDNFSLIQSIHFIHHPPLDCNIEQLMASKHPAYKRLAVEELTAHVVSLKQARAYNDQLQAFPLPKNSALERMLQGLPFTLTADQKSAIDAIGGDMAKNTPMMRLLQGDVGSGKTVVAMAAMGLAASNGLQAACMVPTEILADQHHAKIKGQLSPLGFDCTLLSGSIKSKQRKEALTKISSGQSKIIIGTHSLFQKDVQFDQLGLVVIDEQHRFGVHQRLQVNNKGKKDNIYPHQLVMTATPIPRSLAMAVYAGLDYSVIKSMPPNHKKSSTIAVSQERRDEVIERIWAKCRENEQVFWVCTIIDESEALSCQAAVQCRLELTEKIPNLNIALIHSGLSSEEKQNCMDDFRCHKIDILVATTVIEVGVDMPNANFIVIENAERLGLLQLHQLRGRVGRGGRQGHCILLYKEPLSDKARQRLLAIRNMDDGFLIAHEDMRIRGHGEIYGTQQSGLDNFKAADLQRDEQLLTALLPHVDQYLTETPDQAQQLVGRWLRPFMRYIKV